MIQTILTLVLFTVAVRDETNYSATEFYKQETLFKNINN